MSIQEALALIKSAGYSVSKARKVKAKVTWPLPVAEATFTTGDVVRMSIYTPADNPNERRGRALCEAAIALRIGYVPTMTNFEFTPHRYYETGPFDGDRLAA